jgi:hypothetical protein
MKNKDNKDRGFLEVFLITLFSTGLLFGLVWVIFSWDWIFYFITIVALSIFVGVNQNK